MSLYNPAIEYETLKYVLNYFIKSKNECVDRFILFNEEAAHFALTLASAYEEFTFGQNSTEARRLRVFKFELDLGDGILKEMQMKLISLIEGGDSLRAYLIDIDSREQLPNLIKSYAAPFRFTPNALDEFLVHIRKALVSSHNSH